MTYREDGSEDAERELQLLEVVRRLPERPGYAAAIAGEQRDPRKLFVWHTCIALLLAAASVSAWHHFQLLVLRIVVAGALAVFAFVSAIVAFAVLSFAKRKPRRFPAAVLRIANDGADPAASTVWLVTGDGGAVAVAARRFADDLPRTGDSGVAVVTHDAKLERFHKL